MKCRWLWLIFLVLLWNGTALAGAKQVCFKCHPKAKLLKGKTVHAPLQKGQCNQCHYPHVSKYKFLLKKSQTDLCFSCHKNFYKEMNKASVIHEPVRKKSCLRCHEAHSSSYKYLLRKSVKDVCFSCHKKTLSEKFKYQHKPFKSGNCLACHDPHFGKDTKFLKSYSNKLCFSCHKNSKRFTRIHGNKIDKISCLSCHQPHGSNNKALLRAISHVPYAKKDCKVCHASKRRGINTCLKCHQKVMKSFDYFHNHLLGGYQENSCLLCHNPHVADTKELLRDTPGRLCASCHPQADKQKRDSIYVHPKRDNCLECHLAHGANHPAMLKGDGNQVCVRCHKTQGKFTHPVGEKVLDPRDGQPVTCITCHEPMGTNFKNELKLSGEATLCLECHKNY